MATEKQIEANRINALKSTGPRTEEGRAFSRLNSYKHGLTGHLLVMTDDEREAHDTFVAGIVDSLKPADALERQLAHSIADGYWRINRVSAIESNFFAGDAGNQVPDPTDAAEPHEIDVTLAPALTFLQHPERFQLLTVYEMRLHRKVRLDLQQLRDIQATRRADEAKKAEQEQAANRNAFDESCALLELNLRHDDQLDLDGKFTHPNGFVYSIPKLLLAMTVNRRLQHARQNVATNPFTASQLESLLPSNDASAEPRA
jgi:hypothetical protein